MNCLDDILCGKRTIIGIRDYSDCVKPESSLWLNDLPGISLKIASNVANAEVQTGAELMKKCVTSAIREVFEDFEKEISPYFDFNAIVETREINDYTDATVLPVANLNRGLILKRWRSELAQIHIEEVYLKTHSGTPEVVTIKIYDGEELAVELTNVALVADKIKTLRVDRKFNSETVKILLDNSSVEVYSLPFNSRHKENCGYCSEGSQGFVVKGWNGTEEDNNIYGLGVKAYVQCYNENIMCMLLPRLYLPIWYKSGSKFMKERIYSDRLNPVAAFTKDQAKELFNDYELEYKQRYAGTVKNIQAFLRSTKGECITCNGNHYAQVHP